MEDLIFSFYPSFYEFARDLPAKARLAFYDAILAYFFDGVEPPPENSAYSAFVLVKKTIDKSKRMKQAGRNGGRKGGLATGASKGHPGNDYARKTESRTESKTETKKDKEVGVGKGNTPQSPLPLPKGFDAKAAFDEFWKAYPSECPRRTDKKKCGEKYQRLMRDAKDPAALHREILDGIEVWKRCDTWTKDGGQFIRAPLVWLNSENWKDAPSGGDNAPTEGESAADEAMRKAVEMGLAAAAMEF